MNNVPEIIGKYKIIEVVARGGMGLVYKAKHPNLKHQVIIKKLTIRGNKPVLERFKREARVLLELQHANIVRMFDYFTEGSFHYIVLEFIDGMALDKLLKKAEKVSWQIALLIVRDSCKALQFAHSKGVIHRDVKPGNILISSKGEIKLADFGIASSEKDSEIEEDITQAGVTLGTPAYMPPEQFEDSKNVTARADIYAMGVMLYEMVTGKKPYNATMAPETLIQIKKGQYTLPNKLETKLPLSVTHIIKKMMHPNEKMRYKDASAVLKAVNKQLKKFDVRSIRVSMVKLMLMQKYIEPVYMPKNKGIHKIAAIVCASLLFIGVIFFCWNQGFVHRYLLRAWYTPVSVVIETSKTSSINPDVPMTARFFHNDNDELPDVEDGFRLLRKTQENDSSSIYATKPLYIIPGLYRVKVVVGSDVFWKSLKVDANEQVVEFDIFTAEERNLSVNTVAYDMETGEDISAVTGFFVIYGDDWVPITELTNGELKTGSIVKIRAISDGYVTENYSLLIDWYQDELSIEALMQKE